MPGWKPGSGSTQKCRRGEFFGLRETDASDPWTGGEVVSERFYNIDIVKVVPKSSEDA